MKVRIKKTGEIKTVCDSYGNPQEYKLDEIEIIQDEPIQERKERDWDEVYIKAAIAATQGILSNSTMVDGIREVARLIKKDESETLALSCVGYASQLVEQLKRKND